MVGRNAYLSPDSATLQQYNSLSIGCMFLVLIVAHVLTDKVSIGVTTIVFIVLSCEGFLNLFTVAFDVWFYFRQCSCVFLVFLIFELPSLGLPHADVGTLCSLGEFKYCGKRA